MKPNDYKTFHPADSIIFNAPMTDLTHLSLFGTGSNKCISLALYNKFTFADILPINYLEKIDSTI